MNLLKVAGAALVATLIGSAPLATAQIIQHPDVSESHITFAASGDIWVVGKQGGRPRRLSSSVADEEYPRLSPDGTQVAFSAPDGVHVVPTAGGASRRITFHPAPTKVVDWTPDGQAVLFVSGQDSPLPYRFGHLFRVPAAGGLVERLPYVQAEHAAVSPDGRTIALQPEAREFFLWSPPSPWKGYRGGKSPDVWLVDVATHAAHNVTRHRANDESPVWVGEQLLFLSDRGNARRTNVWAYDRRRRTTRRLTHFADVDIAAIGASAVDAVFVAAGQLHVLDVPSGRTRHVPLDFDALPVEVRIVRPVAPIHHARISPDGAVVAAEARGEIFLISTQEGQPPSNITNSSGIAERSPEWAPDGRTLAYVTDRTGEYQIAVYSTMTGRETILSTFRAGYPQHLRWAPDGRRLSFVDEQRRLNIFDTATRTHVVSEVLAAVGTHWSPDGRWIACTRRLPNGHSAIFLYDTREH